MQVFHYVIVNKDNRQIAEFESGKRPPFKGEILILESNPSIGQMEVLSVMWKTLGNENFIKLKVRPVSTQRE